MKKKRSVSAPNRRTERITRADLKQLATKAALEAVIEPLATKAALEAAIEPLATNVELAKKADKVDLEQSIMGVLKVIEATEARLLSTLREEIAQHTRASAEHVITTLRTDIAQFAKSADDECQRRVAGVDDKYADLPERVTALEARRRR